MPTRPKTYKPSGLAAKAGAATVRLNANARGYTWKWEKARASFLADNPLCAECKRDGRLVYATVVDHIIPHKGDRSLFWDADGNWQSLCATCHNAKSAREK